MRNLIYCRVSSDMQKTDMQVKLCKEIAEKNGGETLLFVDEAVSTRIPMKKRPQLQLFLDSLREGDLVIVYDLDRVGRSVIEGATIYQQIKASGAKITSVTDPNCSNEFFVNIKFSMAQEERRRISERTRDKLLYKQSKFEKVGNIWYGYKLDPNVIQTDENARTYGKPFKLIPEPREQEAIAIMKDMHLKGCSYQAIADHLKESGFLTRVGTPFAKMTIYRILQRELNHSALEAKRAEWSLAEV